MTALILVLLILGTVFLVAEAHVPSYGALGTAGVGALVAGIVVAVLNSGGSVLLALAIGVPIVAVAGVLGLIVTRTVLTASRRRARCGAEGLIGRIGVVRRPLAPLGHVMVDGELWRARQSWVDEGEPPPAEGEPVVVDRVQGLTLTVRRAESWEVDR